jgi:hypothetical protein
MCAIYSGPSCNFPQPRAREPFRSLRGIDRVTVYRATAGIWFPRSSHSAIRLPQFFCPTFLFLISGVDPVTVNRVKNKGLAIVPRLFQAILSPSHSELFESNGPVCCIQSSDHMKHREAGASLEQLWRGTADSNKGSVN